MAATVHVDESNGASETVTEAITHAKLGPPDTVHLDPDANPITPGTNSREKWHRWHLTDLGGALRIEGLRYYAETTPASGGTHAFNGHTTQATYDASKKTVYEQPGTGSTKTPNTVATTEPASANIGIGGSLTGSLSAAGRSDYLLIQLRVAAGATQGGDPRGLYGYDEVA